MTDRQTVTAMSLVAVSTVAAAHRRDHAHDIGEAGCRPHKVEVIRLGKQAVTVCHDCCADTGYMVARDAESVAAAHRQQTLLTSVQLGPPSAA